jgi:hypothetical protein
MRWACRFHIHFFVIFAAVSCVLQLVVARFYRSHVLILAGIEGQGCQSI